MNIPVPKMNIPEPTMNIPVPTMNIPVPTAQPDLEQGPVVLPRDNNAVPDRETDKDVQPRRTFLPPFLSNFIRRIAGVFLWFIPRSIQRWWSPLHSTRPIGEKTYRHIVFSMF